MKQTLLKKTPSQTAGPFFHYVLMPDHGGYAYKGLAQATIADAAVAGQQIGFEGTILDGQGQPMSDALVELWQADAMGRYAHPADPRSSNAAFKGFGRAATDAQGHFKFQTIKPGAIGDGQAPHLTLILFTRGGQNHLYTRAYFADETPANATDPVLASVPADRRGTLIAARSGTGYVFNIRVQGEGETVFFDV